MTLGKGKRVRKRINYNMDIILSKKIPATEKDDNEEVLDDGKNEPDYIPDNSTSGIFYICFI